MALLRAHNTACAGGGKPRRDRMPSQDAALALAANSDQGMVGLAVINVMGVAQHSAWLGKS